MVISKFQNSFSALQAILRYPNSFLGTINDSGILHCTQTIKIINYSVIKCQKNGAKMNKIVQKWQFQKTFYTTMETVLGFSQNRLAELFQNYVFSTNQYLYFDLYVAECQIQFFWLMSRFGRYVSPWHYGFDIKQNQMSWPIVHHINGCNLRCPVRAAAAVRGLIE